MPKTKRSARTSCRTPLGASTPLDIPQGESGNSGARSPSSWASVIRLAPLRPPLAAERSRCCPWSWRARRLMAPQLPAPRPAPPQPSPRMPTRSRRRTGRHQMRSPARPRRAAELKWCPAGMGRESRATEASGGAGAQQRIQLRTGEGHARTNTQGARLLSWCGFSGGGGWWPGSGSSSPPPTIAPARTTPPFPTLNLVVAQLAGAGSEHVSEQLA